MRSILTANPGHKTTACIDQLDPRLRLLLVLALASVLSFMENRALMACFLVAGVVVCWLSSVRLSVVLWRFLLMDTFIIALLVTLPFSTGVQSSADLLFSLPLSDNWQLEASKQGAWLALSIFLKANAIMLFLQAFVGSMNIAQLSQAMAALRMPDKLVFLLVFTMRYLSVIHEQYRRMRQAMKVRAFQAGMNMHSLRTLGYLVGMLLIRSLERSERVHQAMKCRGFVGKLHRLPRLEWQMKDSLVSLVTTLLLLTALSIDYGVVA